MAKRERKKKEVKYLNFPIQMLSGFLLEHDSVLNNIVLYGLYHYGLTTLKLGEPEERFIASMKHFGTKYNGVNDWEKAAEARTFYENFNALLNTKPPMVGLNLDIFWDYLTNEKTEFEKVCLLGFLSIKSILQKKPYCKMTNLFWLSRMDGKSKCVSEPSELSPEIRFYHNEYQTKKIKNELQDNWSLMYYARYTRGFYVSFKLDKEKLVYHAEMRRKATKEKQRKFEEKCMLDRVLNQINNPEV